MLSKKDCEEFLKAQDADAAAYAKAMKSGSFMEVGRYVSGAESEIFSRVVHKVLRKAKVRKRK